MLYRFLVFLSLSMLACAGIGERIVEQATGGEVEMMEGGMDLTLPDGGTVQLRWADKATHAPDIRLSPPEGGEIGLSGLAAIPSMPTSYFVVYSTSANPEDLVAQYTGELEAMSLVPTTNTTEDGATQVKAEQGEMTHFATIASEDDGTTSVTLGVGSIAAIEQGLQQYTD